jgi:hypothetical protein
MILSEKLHGFYSGDLIDIHLQCSTLGGEAKIGQCVTGGVANYYPEGYMDAIMHVLEGVCSCEAGTNGKNATVMIPSRHLENTGTFAGCQSGGDDPCDSNALNIDNGDHNCPAHELGNKQTCTFRCKEGFEPSSDDGLIQCHNGDLAPLSPSCKKCLPDYYSSDGHECQKCPKYSTSSKDSTHCRCIDDYYYDHWTADNSCKECASGTLCRTLPKTELTVVEGRGGRAEQKAEGFWIHSESMSALHCIPGNCVSCDSAARRQCTKPDQDSPECSLQGQLPEKLSFPALQQFYNDVLLQLLGTGGDVMQHSAANASSSALLTNGLQCNDTSPSACLDLQRQLIGTCCRPGHHGTLCAHCDDGLVKAKGLCMPCQSFNFPKLLLMIGVYIGICLFFWRKATLKLSKAADVDENAQSSAIAIVTFFFQTITLLDIDSGFSLGNSLGILNLEPDNPSPSDTDTEGSCLTSGRFYVDWAVKFTVPLVMAAAGFLSWTAASMLSCKSHSARAPAPVCQLAVHSRRYPYALLI